MDRISKLPIGIIETILCFLPIQDAARTSILSREWRYNWIKIPKLEFIQKTFKEAANDGVELSVLEQTFDQPSQRRVMTKRCKLFYAIYQVLLMHRGPIHEFNLKMMVDDSCVEIDHIILHLSMKNTVKTFKLEFIWRYTLPVSFFSLHELTELYLDGCVLDHQPSFFVFGSLTTLHLQDIWTSEKALVRLLSSCPLLKRLTVLTESRLIDFKGNSTIADLIECLTDIEYLCVAFFIFMCFSPNRLPKDLPTKMIHLKYLRLECVWFSHKYAVPFFAFLIRISPNLKKLKIKLSIWDFDDSEMGSFRFEDYSDIMFENLNELEILDFSDGDNELAVVKLILAKSRVPKNVRIRIWDGLDKDDWEMLSSLPCASPVVKISILG